MAGNIAFIERGTCSFVQKVRNAQHAGATAVIVAQSGGQTNSTIFSMLPTSADPGSDITIPSVMISYLNGLAIQAQLSGVVQGTISAPLLLEARDGNFDNGIIAHEYGHGISNRLTGGPSTVHCLTLAEQGGEGWSDFFLFGYDC